MARYSPSLVALCLASVVAIAIAHQQPCNDEDCTTSIVRGDLTKADLPTGQRSLTIPILGNPVDCAALGSSSSELTSCPASDRVQDVRIKNNGRINMEVFFIRPNGRVDRRFELRPGFESPLANFTCVGHRWLVRSTCGQCMFAREISDTSAGLIEVSNQEIEMDCPGPQGSWSPVQEWQNSVVTGGLANIPGSDRVLGFAAVQEGSFRRDDPLMSPLPPARKTQVEIYDYSSNTFQEADLIGHHMFCSAITLLPDGRFFAQGGGPSDDGRLVSTFNPFAGANGQWERQGDTNNGHYFGTVVVTKEQSLLLALGFDTSEVGFQSWARRLDYPEMSRGLNFGRRWKNMTGIDMEGKQPESRRYPVMHLMPNGDILESGTMNNMWQINTSGRGSISFAGKRNTRRDEGEAWGSSTIMFEEGKLLTIGGIENWAGDRAPGRFVVRRAIVIDMNNGSQVQTFETEPLTSQRAFANTVVLPSGEVLAIGGKDNIVQYDDSRSAKKPELWNPKTGKWTELAEHQSPRNYHSAAILLRDGRVLASGGGLCPVCNQPDSSGNILNQPTLEIFSPPYLFDERGRPKIRPVIRRSPATTARRRTMRIVVGGPQAGFIERVSMVKQSAVTHTLSTDARQIELRIVVKVRLSNSRYLYRVRTNSNINVMTPGYWFMFVLDGTGTPSVAKEIQVLV